MRRALTRGPVVADRYASSVAACHAAVNGVDLEQVQELMAPFLPYLIRPRATFYLLGSDTSLRQRMTTKTDVKQDDTNLFNVPGRLTRLRDNFKAIAAEARTVLLPTDGRSPEDLADAVAAHLETPRA